jgi:hypothetical protein
VVIELNRVPLFSEHSEPFNLKCRKIYDNIAMDRSLFPNLNGRERMEDNILIAGQHFFARGSSGPTLMLTQNRVLRNRWTALNTDQPTQLD